MIRLTSIAQALSLRGTIPELAVIRSLQFMGDGYDPEEHGHIIVVQGGDDIIQIEEVGTDGFFVDDVPTFECVESFVDGDRVVMEIVLAIDCDRTVAIIADESCLDNDLRRTLQKLSTPPQPMPTMKGIHREILRQS